MKLFKSKQPKPQPIQPRQETILTVETAYICAACGKPDATILIAPVSYFGYIKLAHVRLCRSCHDMLIENQCNHHFHQRKEWPDTSIRLEAIQVAKQKSVRQA